VTRWQRTVAFGLWRESCRRRHLRERRYGDRRAQRQRRNTRVAVVPGCTCQEAGRHVPYQAGKASGSSVTGFVLPELTPGNSGYFDNLQLERAPRQLHACSSPAPQRDSRPASYQPQRHRPSAPNGGSLAAAIIQPTLFASVASHARLNTSTRRPAGRFRCDESRSPATS